MLQHSIHFRYFTHRDFVEGLLQEKLSRNRTRTLLGAFCSAMTRPEEGLWTRKSLEYQDQNRVRNLPLAWIQTPDVNMTSSMPAITRVQRGGVTKHEAESHYTMHVNMSLPLDIVLVSTIPPAVLPYHTTI
jgi:hypothetical protein